MGWFSKKEDYDINNVSSYEVKDLKIKMDYEGSKYGLHEKINDNGSKHVTYWDGDTNTRYSQDTDNLGNTTNGHHTDQNKHKGDPDRH